MLTRGKYPLPASGKFQWTDEEVQQKYLNLKQVLSNMWSTLLDASSIHGIKFLDRCVLGLIALLNLRVFINILLTEVLFTYLVYNFLTIFLINYLFNLTF